MNRTYRTTKSWVIALIAVTATIWSAPTQAQSHEYIMMMRSSTQNHIFVSESVEGVYGGFKTSTPSDANSNTAAISPSSANRSVWQGYELRTAIGLELMKFVSFSAAHNSVNLRSKDDGQERLNGSKLSGEAKMSFLSPVGNLEFGGAVTGSRYDYQRSLSSGGYFGSGYYYLIGWNYFMSYNVSLFGTAKIVQEHMVPNGGAADLPTIDSNMSSLGAGFSLWL